MVQGTATDDSPVALSPRLFSTELPSLGGGHRTKLLIPEKVREVSRGRGSLSRNPPLEEVLIARCEGCCCEQETSCHAISTVKIFLWPLGRSSGCQERRHGVCPHVGITRATLSLSHPPTVTVCSPEEERKGEKIYLYTHLKQQPIW